MTITVRIVAAPELDLVRHTLLQRDAFARRFGLIRASTVQTEAYYAWKYSSPAGVARIAQAFDGDTLVASASAVPVRLASERSALRAWQLCDLATAPHMRRRGIFSSCLARLLADLGQRAPVYCMPNAQSYAPLRRAGFAEVGRLRLYLTLRFRLGQWARSGHAPVTTAPRGLGLDLLDPATLDWRFRLRPEIPYEVAELDGAGVIALRAVGGHLACAVVGLRIAAADPKRVIEALSRALGGRRYPALLTLSQEAPPWRRHSWLIPQSIMPRQFPILALDFPAEALSFSAAEWDVL
jgi:GNAT acetyltransferase-like protein